MITEYRNAVIERLRQTIPQATEVEPFNGVFNMEEVKRRIVNAPSIYVSCLGIRAGEGVHTGESYDPLEMAAYVFARHQGLMDAEAIGWSLAAAIRLQLSGRHFADGFGMASGVGVQNLWSGELDREGSTIMAVTWTVEAVLGADWLETDLDFQADDFVYPDELILRPRVRGAL